MSRTPTLNGSGHRKLASWIDAFVEHTDNLESAPIFRKWSAIATLAAVMEQKTYVVTSSPLYPNLYVFLVGHAGIGKSRAITSALGFVREVPELHLGATSMTMASLVDHMNEAKRTIIEMPNPAIEYNSLFVSADELSAFMDQYDSGLIAGLTTFYDCVPYSQGRRVRDIRIKIARPQLNILSGTTPSNLIRFIPDFAWEQGFTSRIIMVYSEEKPMIDVFKVAAKDKPKEMIHDLKVINGLVGQFGWTEDYARAMHQWKVLGFPPIPEHPKLRWYCERRYSHMFKLSMVASVDRSNELMLTKEDFNKAMGWLLEAEIAMPEIFRTGAGTIDSKAMDEILHFVQAAGPHGIIEHQLVKFARTHIQFANNVIPILVVMERAGMIKAVAQDKITGMRTFTACQ